MDSGYNETHNPFADVSEEYTKKKEENMAKKAVKRISAQQRQINKVNAKSNKYQNNNFNWTLVFMVNCFIIVIIIIIIEALIQQHRRFTWFMSMYMYIQLDILTIMGLVGD